MSGVPISDVNRRNGQQGWLDASAARAYERMKAAGMPGGCLSDAGRTNAEQAALYAAFLRGELAATAARPGESLHEVGNAIDIAEPARSWVRARSEYGFAKDTVANEPWHMVYGPDTDQHQDEEADEMAVTLEEMEELVRTVVRSESRKLWEEAAAGSTGSGRAFRTAVRSVVASAVEDARDALVEDLAAALPTGALTRAQLKTIVENRVRAVRSRREAR
ncbi:M15 family metallopeptidase [Cellulomonas sp. DKR-3]|uniref:M15 family metallopeptidase n=1 Tax=Cellulomonas fulva TaxID=2835530 RepID=A0ABS5TUB3_9CELL|nr:M15 family metallopeptidase [Cellulomonas fulva]MBT0992730.1 M15 family metallopeptidase [Cellulomonas fulva]